MKERLKKIAPWVGYPFFYIACFVVFGVLTFPFDKLREHVVASFNAKQRETNGHDELQIGEMSGYWLSGIKVKDLRFVSASTDPTKPPSELVVDEGHASISLLPLLIGNVNVSFDADALGGHVKGIVEMHGKDKNIEVELEDVDVGKIPQLVQLIGLPMEGKLSGTVKIAMPEGKASKGNGTIALEMRDVAIGDGKAKLKGLLPLPKMVVGELSLTGDAKDGLIKITKLAAAGKDLDFQGEGQIQMKELATESVIAASLRFKLSDGYRAKNDMTKGLFGLPGDKITPAFELDPKVKASKRVSDGFYVWSVHGKLGQPDFQPAGGSGPVNAPTFGNAAQPPFGGAAPAVTAAPITPTMRPAVPAIQQ